MEVVVVTKLKDVQSSSQIVTTNAQLFTGQMPCCHPSNSVEALNGN